MAMAVLVPALVAPSAPAAEKPLTPAEAWRIGWPTEMGPNLNWSANPCGIKLVDDITKVRHVWRSEERVPQSKHNNAGDPAIFSQEVASIGGGSASPVMAGGRAYVTFWEPAGPCVDPVERLNGTRFWDGGLVWDYARRQKVEQNGGWRRGCLEADDVVLCVDATNGRTLWKRAFSRLGLNFQSRKNDAIHASPCYADRRVYALTTTCRVLCLDAVSGELLWESTAMADFPERWLDKLVVMASGHRVPPLAFYAGYSSLAVIDGRLIVRNSAGGLQAFDAKTGEPLWTQMEAGLSATHPLPFVWRHQGRSFLLGIRYGTVVCTDAADGRTLWKKEAPIANPTVAGDVLVGVPTVGKGKEILLNGYRLTLQGVEHLWQADPKEAGYGYYGNFPSTAADGTVLAPRHLNSSRGGGDHTFSAMVRLDPLTGKVLKTYPAEGIAHHLALCDLDDGWIWSKIWYRNYLYLQADAQCRQGSELPQIADEGRMFNTAYSFPVNDAYAAGRMVLRGNFYLHGLDFRADPGADPPVAAVPAWAQKLAEPVRGLASRYQRERDTALKAWGSLGAGERQARLGDVLALLEADDAAAQISAARALAAPGLDAAKSGPVLRAALLKAVDAGRGEYAGLLAAALRAPEAATAVAEKLGAAEPARLMAACAALAGFGPAGAGAVEKLAALATHDDVQVACAAMKALGAVDQKGVAADRLVPLLQQENLTRRLAAADALGAMGAGAGAALPKIVKTLNPILDLFTAQKYEDARRKQGKAADDRLVAGRLVWVLGRIGKEAVPALSAICEKNKQNPEKLVRFLLIGSLAQAGSEAAGVAAKWFDSGDRAAQAMAIELVESLVRHQYPPAILEPFCNARMAGAPTELTVRAAEWLLRADGTHAKGLATLIDLCQGDATPDLIRQLAAEALSRQVITVHNGMSDDARRRGTKALVSVIARGKASPIVILQCAGLAPFLEKDEQTAVQRAQGKVPANFSAAKIYIPYFDRTSSDTKPGD
jgi:outer membrane protein assembly factor BamB